MFVLYFLEVELIDTTLTFIIKMNNKYFMKWLNMCFKRGVIDVCIVCIVKWFNRHWLDIYY